MRHNVVGIVTELTDGSTTNPGSILGNGKRFLPTQKLQDRFWDPTWELFPRWQSDRDVKLTTHFHVMLSVPSPPICIHGKLKYNFTFMVQNVWTMSQVLFLFTGSWHRGFGYNFVSTTDVTGFLCASN
jgi:hypothetical protein